MSNNSQSEKYRQAKAILKEYQKLQDFKNRIYFEEGKIFYTLAKNSLYKAVFGEDKYSEREKSWKRFTLEVTKMPTPTADQKRKNYEKWILQLGYKPEELQDVTFTKLFVAIPFADTRTTSDEILSFIRTTDNNDSGQPVTDFLAYLKDTYKNTP